MTKDEIRAIVSASSEMALIISNYYMELKNCGFSDENAIKFALSYQESIMRLID